MRLCNCPWGSLGCCSPTAVASAGQGPALLQDGEWEYWTHVSHRPVFPHHLVGAGLSARLLSAASPSPSLVGTCSWPLTERGRGAAPATYIARLKCFHLSADRSHTTLCPSCLTLSPYRCSSQAQEARYLAALRHRVPRLRVRAGHRGDQRADRVRRLSKVRLVASLSSRGLRPCPQVVTAREPGCRARR